MITPELARLQSNENAWKKLSIYCKKGMQWAIDNGLAKVRINYNNRNYGYFYRDIKILKNIGFSLEILDEAKYANIDTIKDARSYIIIHW
jgi:hypothetical protein